MMRPSIPLRAGPVPRMNLRYNWKYNQKFSQVDIKGDLDSLKMVENHQDDEFATASVENNKPKKAQIKKTLALDLDETLICTYNSGECEGYVADFRINFDGNSEPVFMRPGLKEFLEEMDKCYNVIIWTAAT